MRPADRASSLVIPRLTAVENNSPGRQAEANLLVPIASTMYTGIQQSWSTTIARRRTLIGYLTQQGFFEPAWKLTRCGVTPNTLARRVSQRRRVLGCHMSYCPTCARLRQNRIFSRMRPWVEGQMGEFGASAHLKLALPSSQGRVLERLSQLGKEVRSVTSTRDWREGFSLSIGVVMTLEIGPGGDQRGHPHAHLFIYASTKGALDPFLDWLKTRWARRVRQRLIEGAGLSIMGPDPNEWAPRLRYILKGNRIQPGWPQDLLEQVIEAITSRKRLFSVWGMAVRQGGWTRARFATNIQAFRSAAQNQLRATG